MTYIVKTTSGGLIHIKPSHVIHIRRPNSLEGAKVLGKPLVINADHIVFLSYNTEGSPAYFMANGFEICVKILYEEAGEALQCAKDRQEKTIR